MVSKVCWTYFIRYFTQNIFPSKTDSFSDIESVVQCPFSLTLFRAVYLGPKLLLSTYLVVFGWIRIGCALEVVVPRVGFGATRRGEIRFPSFRSIVPSAIHVFFLVVQHAAAFLLKKKKETTNVSREH